MLQTSLEGAGYAAELGSVRVVCGVRPGGAQRARREPRWQARAGGSGVSLSTHHGHRPLPRGRSHGRDHALARGADGQGARPAHRGRECGWRRRHAGHQAGRQVQARRLHDHGREHGHARRRARALPGPRVRPCEGLRADRHGGGHRHRDRSAQGLSRQELEGVRGTPEGSCERGERGARRSRLDLLRGVPDVAQPARHQTDAWPIEAPRPRSTIWWGARSITCAIRS